MDKPHNYPNIVYKYRNWKEDYHRDVLNKNHLFLTSPKDFNDPFDCRITKNYKLLDTKEKVRKFGEQAIIRNPEYFEKNIEPTKQIEYRLPNDLDEFQRKCEQLIFDEQDKYYGVLSLSAIWNSILMWSHYADYHKGYCVGFWEEKLRKSALGDKGGKVLYPPTKEYPEINPLDVNYLQQGDIQTHTKAFDWKYEEEYRITKLFDFELPPPEDKDRIREIPDEFFAEIVIGLKTEDKDRNEIIEIGRQKGIKVYQAVKVPFKFQIDREEIK